MKKILTAFQKNGFALKNHLVMAPMTRCRAIGNVPNDLMTIYYGQRTGAGLIVTEGVAPTPDGLGYARIPGIFSDAQVEGWAKIANAVHAGDSKIFMQIMHTGRIGHNDNLPEGSVLVGVSDIKAAGQIYTDTAHMQDHSEPVALTTEGVKSVIEGFVTAAKNAVKAGLDGIELHSANGYLFEQFLNPNVNNRTDEYGGSIVNRARFVIEVAQRIADAIGPEKVGIRFSPYAVLGDLQAYDRDEVHETYAYLAKELNKIGITYLHISVSAEIPQKTFDAIRSNFTNTIILCNGLTAETGEKALNAGFADLIGFGRAFLANPDLITRIEKNAPLNEADPTTFFGLDGVGYTDYPTLEILETHSV